MYNPLALLEKEHIDTLIAKGYRVFVRQSYARGLKHGVKEAFLFTPYKSIEDAQEHIMAIILEGRTEVYDINKPDQKARLYKAASQPPGYGIYINRLKDHSWNPPRSLQAQIHHFVKMLGWGSRNMNIETTLALKYGKLVVRFTNNGISEEAPLDEIEKI
jgi:hypothetical protein